MTRMLTPTSLSLLLVLTAPLACEGGDGDDVGETDGASTGTDGEGGDDEGGGGGGDGGGGDGSDDGTDGADDGADEGGDDGPEPEEDHALGRILMAELHQSGSGTATGSVTAAFLPDAEMLGSTCTQTVAGCEISLVAECPTGCGDGEYCGFDEGCNATCLEICDASCGVDEVCYFAAPGQAACRDREDFDAGALTFTGATAPITLLPPYALNDLDTGSPFAPGAQISVSASGAVDAGLAAFDASFTATQLLQG